MFAKLALALKSKVAIAIVGAVVVVGAGTTAALAATGAHIQLPLVAQSQNQQHHTNNSNDDHGNAQSTSHHDGQQAEGVISSIDAGHSSFVLKPQHGASVTVVVNAKTVFEAGVGSFAGLKVGSHVEAKGTLQANGTLLASQVEGQGANHGDSSDGHGNSGSSGSSGSSHNGHDDSTPHT